jgi:hypothetical protein
VKKYGQFVVSLCFIENKPSCHNFKKVSWPYLENSIWHYKEGYITLVGDSKVASVFSVVALGKMFSPFVIFEETNSFLTLIYVIKRHPKNTPHN